jgi:tRNA1(Val) A37 N6-methylase TrmN6
MEQEDEAGLVSRDAFHHGAFEVLQPRDRGHRTGSDALLIAACLPQGTSGRLADLGSGVGTAALAALSCNPGLEAVLVEIEPRMARLAERSLALPVNGRIAKRASVLIADVALSGLQREKAGLAPESFDHVIMNPPYNHSAQRASPDEMRSLAHSMATGGLDPWLRTAAAILKPGGTLTMIWRTERLADILAGAQGRFGDIVVVPVHPRAGERASRVLVRAVRGSRAPLAIAPGIVMHEDDNSPTPLASDLLNGRARVSFAA